MINIKGLENVNSIGRNLEVVKNESLSTCEIESICNYLANPNGSIDIQNNATGCNSQGEVGAACGVEIPENNIESEFSIYPNPAKNILNISSHNGVTIERIIIYNQTGQKVIEGELSNNLIDVSKLPQGIYIVEIVCKEWMVRRKLKK